MKKAYEKPRIYMKRFKQNADIEVTASLLTQGKLRSENNSFIFSQGHFREKSWHSGFEDIPNSSFSVSR